MTSSLTDVQSAIHAERVVNTNFCVGDCIVFDLSENDLHFVQWFLTAADALFFESPGSVVCCSLNIVDISLAVSLIQFSFEGVLVFLDGLGLFGDVLVGVIIDSENGVDVL